MEKIWSDVEVMMYCDDEVSHVNWVKGKWVGTWHLSSYVLSCHLICTTLIDAKDQIRSAVQDLSSLKEPNMKRSFSFRTDPTHILHLKFILNLTWEKISQSPVTVRFGDLGPVNKKFYLPQIPPSSDCYPLSPHWLNPGLTSSSSTLQSPH